METRPRLHPPTTMGVVRNPSTPAERVSRTVDGDTTVLAVGGSLDTDTGQLLVAEVKAAIERGTNRLDIDLQGIESFDEPGAAALLTCRDAAGDLDGGLHYRTRSGGVGQDALLQAYAHESA